MEDIGDYLYLIIIAIAGLSGILKKKKKESPIQTSPQEEDLTEYEDNYEELVQVDPIPKVDFQPTTEKMTNNENSRNHKLKHTEYSRYSTTINSSVLKSHKKSSRLEKSKAVQDLEYEEEHMNDDETELNIQFNSSSDAKLAFIYSEIINRKY